MELDASSLLNTARENLGTTLAILVLLLMVTGAAGLYVGANPQEETFSFDAEAQVLNSNEVENLTWGIAAGEGMDFGRMVNGTNITKTLEMSSEKEALVLTEIEGNISDQIDYKQVSRFEGNETRSFVMAGGEPGYYSGTIRVETLRPSNTLDEVWLDLRYYWE